MKKRIPAEVIDAILTHIPPEITILHAQLKRIRSNSLFIAPECWGRSWGAIADQLQQFLSNPPKYDWEKRVANIFADKEIFEIP
jgi:hypothetical protein